MSKWEDWLDSPPRTSFDSIIMTVDFEKVNLFSILRK